MKPWPGIGALCLALALLAAPPAGASPAPPPPAADPAATRQQLRQRLGRLLAQRRAIRKRIDDLRRELRQLKQQVDQASRSSLELQQEEARLVPRLEKVRRQTEVLEDQLRTLRRRYGRRMRALYLFGSDRTYTLLGSAHDFNDYLVRSQYLTRLAQADHRRLVQMHQRSRQLNRLQLRLSLHRHQVAQLRRSQAERAALLERLLASRDRLLAKLKQQSRSAALTIAALREAEIRLARTFALDQPRPGPPPGYRPAPPVEGRLLRRAGPGRRGVLMAARPGARVRTPWAGRVAYAAPLAGWGRVVIVDHGNRMHTVLAHLGKLSVTAGQKIAAGAVVGAVGTGKRFYLEVRRGARPVDPVAWLRLAP